MAYSRQGDLFEDDPQSDQFGADAPTPVFRADPDVVRAELHKLLTEAKAAQPLSWAPKRIALYRTLVPQMSNWLPRDEAEQLCFAFETGLARLEAA